jgi:aspartate aminotransferase-like enzyme
LGFAAVSDRTLERAKQIPSRGWYFDFLLLEEWMLKSSTPATPAVTLFRAADKQLDDILAEGLDARIARHAQMAETTRAWALDVGFGLFAEAGYYTPTVTVLQNRPGPNLNFAELNAHLLANGFIIANGYNEMRDITFRLAHMGDVQPERLQVLLDTIQAFMAST